jgi:N-acetyl-anhydromuramyl-L-alanine amidase AmpD
MDIKKYLLGDNNLWPITGTFPPSPTDKFSYPKAKQSRTATIRGRYLHEYPEGAVVHFTAGNDNVKQYQEFMKTMGYAAILIDRKGQVWQDFSLSNWGYHAGQSEWGNIRTTVNNHFVGIELISAGPLTLVDGKWQSWFKTEIRDSEVIHTIGHENIVAGTYHSFTPEQMCSLEDLLIWLYRQGGGIFSLDNVVGHDEVSPGRKIDPGACMVEYSKNLVGASIEGIFTMPRYREYLKSKV